MGSKQFDYYVFIDYSENYLGYLIVDKLKMKSIIPQISRFAHYRELKYKSAYLHSIKNPIHKNQILNYLNKLKIRKTVDTLEIYSDILKFLNNNHNCLIFISVDNKQYLNFEKIVKIIDGKSIKVVKESELRKGTEEYKISLVLDTLLNMERMKHEVK